MEYVVMLLLAVIGIACMIIWDMAKENERLEAALRQSQKNDHRHPKGAVDSKGNPMGGKFKKAGK